MIDPTKPSQNLAVDLKGLAELRQSAQQNSPQALKATATQFEALFVNMMMKSMREASPQDGMFDNDQSRLYTSMLDQQLSQGMASRGIGLADMLIRQLTPKGAAPAMPAGDAAGDAPAARIQDAQRADTAKSNPWKAGAPTQSPAGKDLASISRAASANRAGTPAHKPAHVQAFQNRLAAHAEEASRSTGIPARFMIGQAALESGWGKREIRAADGTPSHNLFGIKAGAGWTGKVVEAVTTEYVNGEPHKRVEKFRAYDSYADAFRDFGRLLRGNPRYRQVLANAQDAHGFAQGLQRAGYATDPAYASKLTRIIARNLSA
jgi:peptidoglycan hydrolase FlgJ